MSQFICQHCVHLNDCEDHENLTLNIETCGDYRARGEFICKHCKKNDTCQEYDDTYKYVTSCNAYESKQKEPGDWDK